MGERKKRKEGKKAPDQGSEKQKKHDKQYNNSSRATNIESSAHRKICYQITKAFGNEQGDERVKTLYVEVWFQFVAELYF